MRKLSTETTEVQENSPATNILDTYFEKFNKLFDNESTTLLELKRCKEKIKTLESELQQQSCDMKNLKKHYESLIVAKNEELDSAIKRRDEQLSELRRTNKDQGSHDLERMENHYEQLISQKTQSE
eukprot:UN22788